jgi:hypothetical protein
VRQSLGPFAAAAYNGPTAGNAFGGRLIAAKEQIRLAGPHRKREAFGPFSSKCVGLGGLGADVLSLSFSTSPVQRALLASVALVCCSAPFTQAAGPIVDSGGFEAYTLGTLEGQNGWLSAGSGAGSAMVQSTVVRSGSKAVAVQKGANSDRRWAVPVTGFPTNRFIVIDWDMRVTGTGASAGVFGPLFGIEANDDADSANVAVLGTIGVDSTTGDILYQAQGSGVLLETGTTATFNTWNSYRLVLDFTAHQYSGYFNGVKLVTSGFVDHSIGQPLNHLTDADIAALAASSDSQSMSQTGTAYFDNFKVSDGIVADFNFDGKVNGPDLAAWKSSFGINAGGDANNDGRTDGADFLVWQRQQGVNVVGATAVATAVPEPGAAALASIATAAFAACNRRRSAAR